VRDFMSEEEKKSNADLIIERSIELFGLTPEEISDQNEIWMRKKGYKNQREDEKSYQQKRELESNRVSRLDNLLKRFRVQKRK
jgi:hypothetical protein